MPTMMQMCEDILAHPDCPHALKARYPTPLALYEYSPTGELFNIFIWHLSICQPEIQGPEHPSEGDLRGGKDGYQVWTGTAWVRY